jgi:hypothetical protein
MPQQVAPGSREAAAVLLLLLLLLLSPPPAAPLPPSPSMDGRCTENRSA